MALNDSKLQAWIVVIVGGLLGWAAASGRLLAQPGAGPAKPAPSQPAPSQLAPSQPAPSQPAPSPPTLQTTGEPGSAAATTTIDGKQLPAPDPKFGGVIKGNAAQSKAWWAPHIVPPKQAPNVLLIMTDDVGFAAPSTFGGVIPTPALDRIAQTGLRYTQFHSTALCSPTRAALDHGPESSLGGLRRGLGTVDRLSGIQQRDRQRQGHDRPRSPGQRLCHVVVRQRSQHADVRGQPARAVRPMARRNGFRLLLWLRRRRHQPMGAEPVSQYDGHLPVCRPPGLEPDDRHGRRRHRVAEPGQPDRSEQALFLLLRAGRHPRAASSDARVGREDPQAALVRPGLERAPRNDLCQPEKVGRDPAGRQNDALAERAAQGVEGSER